MTEEKAKSLIGRKVRGFKFDVEIDGCCYEEDMDYYIGEVGEIIDFYKNSFKVEFKNAFCLYPASLIDAHLVEEVSIDSIDSLKYATYGLDYGESESIVETDLIQINPSEYSCKFANITASELINQNEQLKAENAELLEFIKKYYRYLNLKDQEVAKQLLEKYGISVN